MYIEGFILQQRAFTERDITDAKKTAYVLGTGHRQLFRYERYVKTMIMTDNASNCLAGFCVMPMGVFVFHDPPLRVARTDLPLSRRARGAGLIGGGADHWEAVQDLYGKRRGIRFEYVEKPGGQRDNVDLSFAFQIDMGRKSIEYGYYHNPKGLSGDGWIWE